MNNHQKKSFLYASAVVMALLLVSLVFQNCGKVAFSSSDSNQHVLNVPPGSSTCTNQTFQQPNQSITNKVDILIVLHDTGSFAANALTAVTSGISQFVQNLPAGSDYRISTISAINSATDPANSGKVYGTVFNSATVTPQGITTNLQNPVHDATGLHGEYGMSALTAALTTQLTFNQNAGALRPGAALAVFMLANEGDICGLPLNADPGTDDDWAAEVKEAEVYCASTTPASTLMQIQKYSQANGGGYLVGGVIFTTQAPIVSANEAEYGWGYYQLVHDLANGPLVNLNAGAAAIATGIGAVGTLVAKIFTVKTDFVLNQSVTDPSTVSVYINGSATPLPTTEVQVLSNDVHLSNPSDAGGPGQSVLINYCY